MDELLILVVSAVLNGVMLMLGMYLGTRQTGKQLRAEIEDMMKKSEILQMLKKTLTDQTLIEKATKFFEEATTLVREGKILVSSDEAKNFFKNVTELMKELSGEAEGKLKLPPKKKAKQRSVKEKK